MPRSENIITPISPIEKESMVALTVDCVIFGYDQNDLKILTIECDMDPYKGMPSLLGDFVMKNERLDEAASRVLTYCTGNEDIYLEEVRSFSDPDRHPLGRVVTVAFYSLIAIPNTKLTSAADKHLSWISVKDIDKMAFDHRLIFDNCLHRLRKNLREKPIGFELLPKKFSLMQLQTLYEVVLGIELDKRNFRRKLRSLNILLDIGEQQQEVSHRPARLYKFDEESFNKKNRSGLKFEL